MSYRTLTKADSAEHASQLFMAGRDSPHVEDFQLFRNCQNPVVRGLLLLLRALALHLAPSPQNYQITALFTSGSRCTLPLEHTSIRNLTLGVQGA